MSNSTFLPTQNPNSNPNHSHTLNNTSDYSNFEVLDYLMLENGFEEDSSSSFTTSLSQIPVLPQILTSEDVTQSNNMQVKCKGGAKRIQMDVGNRIAFRTKSDLEIMDDGFKWRKYGKKTLKGSSNPRNYYKCSSEGCNVKKRVERDREDSSYVITTYEGVHNHESPCVTYYNEMPTLIPCGWSSQPLHSS